MSGFAPSKFQFLTSTGSPNAYGTINVYLTGTTTYTTIYYDGGLTSAAPNPFTLDANGEGKFYIANSGNIRIDSYTSTGAFIETIDPVFPVGTSSSSASAVVYNGGSLTLATTNASNNIVSTSAFTLTLPVTTGFSSSFQLQLNAQGGAITLAPYSTDKINGNTAGASYIIPANASAELWTDGAGNWGLNFNTGTNASVIGASRNAVMSVTTASATATFTADSITVATALNGNYQLLTSYSQSINLGTTGAGGMDTGTAPASGFVSLYAIAKPDGTKNILACAVATSAASIYAGTHMPSGYTYSALIGIWPTNGSSLFVQGYQRERIVYFVPILVLSGGTATGYTSVSIAGAVPASATGFWGNFSLKMLLCRVIRGASKKPTSEFLTL